MEGIFMNGEVAQICDITIAAKNALKIKLLIHPANMKTKQNSCLLKIIKLKM